MEQRNKVIYTVASVMRSPAVVIEADAAVMEALHLMREKGISSILVKPETSEDSYGIMTKRDVISKVVAKGEDPSKVRVREIMSKPVMTVPPEYSLRECSALMIKKGIRRVPVARGGEIIGIVSDTDIFAAVEERGWGPEY